jgi:hypothetical protein
MSTGRIVLVAVAAIVALNLVGAIVDAATGGTPGGPRSSSYATGGDGLAAYHDLLSDFGHPVERLGTRPADGSLDPSTTVVVLDPQDIQGREARALRRFVESGGRLLAGGKDPAAWLGEIVPEMPGWEGGHANVGGVRTAGGGRWRGSRGPSDLVSVATIGRGRALLLADASPLQNRLLAKAGNAAFGIALAGPRGRRVAFAETVHGYGQARGLAALPERWKWTLGGLLLAAAAWVASRLRRLGPPEEESRPLPPPRRAYVDAVAAALARTHRPAASAERVRSAARERVARRAGLGADPPGESLTRAATSLGLSDAEAAALTRPARGDDEDLMLAGRALARTGRRSG